MKKYLLVGVILVFTSTFFAQSKMSLGLVGGPSHSYLRLLNGPFYGELVGVFKYSVGIQASYHFSDKLSLNSSINFKEKGGETLIEVTDGFERYLGVGELSYDFEFITIPILVRYKFGGKKLKPFINAGPYMGFLIDAYESVYIPSQQQSNERNTSELYRNFDFGFSGGLGLEYKFFDRFLLTAELRHNFGLADLGNDFYFTSVKFNSTNILFGVAYRFGGKSE